MCSALFLLLSKYISFLPAPQMLISEGGQGRLLNEPRLRRDVLRLDDHNLSSNHEEASS
jgi:hypothetical protein